MKKLTLADFPWCAETALEVAKPDWLAACVGVTEKSDPLTRANFDALCDELDEKDPNGSTWEIVRWPNKQVGWYETVFVQPGTPTANVLEWAQQRMAKFPCIDEELWFQYESEGLNPKGFEAETAEPKICEG